MAAKATGQQSAEDGLGHRAAMGRDDSGGGEGSNQRRRAASSRGDGGGGKGSNQQRMAAISRGDGGGGEGQQSVGAMAVVAKGSSSNQP